MERFEVAFEEVMTSDALPMDEIMRYVAAARGKRLRPRLVFLTARLFGDINDSTRRAALFSEMLHTATLIHDDVVDASDIRRGQATLNVQWDVVSAVLAGDYLLAKSLVQLSDPADYRILQEMLSVAMMMCEGELLQHAEISRQNDSNPHNIDAETYLNVIERKTARLIRGCCMSGALSVMNEKTEDRSRKLELTGDFGLNLGLVFQMRDDILDDDDPNSTVLAKQLLPKYLDKALKALEALTPYVKDQEAFEALRTLTVFCAERNH